ncbi:MAG TPA: hypothetical protein VMT30_09480 [Candidatus Saccharimonadia bacterium]|nr:hypothetical protein [Candidatus Saccharimonadia bacterium]
MPDELSALEMAVKARGDQAAEMLREWAPELETIAHRDPSTWTPNDIRKIKGTLLSVYGFVTEGRI